MNEHSRELLIFAKGSIIEFHKWDMLTMINEVFYGDDYFPRGLIDKSIEIYNNFTKLEPKEHSNDDLDDPAYKFGVAISDFVVHVQFEYLFV